MTIKREKVTMVSAKIKKTRPSASCVVTFYTVCWIKHMDVRTETNKLTL